MYKVAVLFQRYGTDFVNNRFSFQSCNLLVLIGRFGWFLCERGLELPLEALCRLEVLAVVPTQHLDIVAGGMELIV